MTDSFDFVVIGGGSAGFNAARVAESQGMRAVIVDGGEPLGGLCILRGCMPSKTLLYMAEVLHLAQKGEVFGLDIPRAAPDMKAMHERKLKIVGGFAAYREQQLTMGRFSLRRAFGKFVDPHTLALSDGTKITGKKFLIATGSRIATPPIDGLANTPAWTSDEVLDLDFVPKSVLVLGGGIVACEMAQFLQRIGSTVTLIQRGATLLRDHSAGASEVIVQAFRDEGMEVFTDTKLNKVGKHAHGVEVTFTHKGEAFSRKAQFLFNALGRVPASEALNLKAAGVHLDEKGRVLVNEFQQSSASHIYAGGDVCGPHDVVHIAIAQGELAARHAAGVKDLVPIDQSLLLNVVFTDPQLATIGFTERHLEKAGTLFLRASYPFNDHGKSTLMDANYGYVKVMADPEGGRILGAEIVGKDAGELIHCFSTPLAMRATVFDMLRAPWYHPTLSEIITYPLEDIADAIKQRRQKKPD